MQEKQNYYHYKQLMNDNYSLIQTKNIDGIWDINQYYDMKLNFEYSVQIILSKLNPMKTEKTIMDDKWKKCFSLKKICRMQLNHMYSGWIIRLGDFSTIFPKALLTQQTKCFVEQYETWYTSRHDVSPQIYQALTATWTKFSLFSPLFSQWLWYEI